MATNENLIPIPGRLHSVASDEIVSGANEIYDDKLSDNLENLNTGFTNDIDTIYNTIGDNNEKGAIMEQLNTIDGRLDTIDGEISALNSIPIEVVPLNSDGTAPNVNNPLENTLYRAYNSDNTLYSDWMYQDGSWVMITQLLEPTSLEKLVGYYTCNTAANTPGKEVITGNSGYVLPANGGAMKIKMTNANTADNATLKIGSETAKPLWYNDERASSSNTWEEGEVISVYYDGENYKASNAMGGGSAVGKKRLTGKTGYVNLTGETAPAPTTSGGSSGQYRYIEYPVHEGDVIYIKGVSGGVLAYTWGLLDSTNNRKIVESAGGIVDYTQKPFVKVIPSGVDTIVINNYNTAYQYYEWYYAKAGSIGAHEILTEQFIYGNLRQLNLGENYIVNEPVKTSDKLLLKINKEIKSMNLTDIVVVGDLKTYGSGVNAATYYAQKAVDIYNYANSPYLENAFAIGSPSGAVIQVSANNEIISTLVEPINIVVTIVDIECSINVTSEDDASSIASKIASFFSTQTEEWSLTVDSIDNTKINFISKAAKDVVPTISSEVGESGVIIGFVENSEYAGSFNLSLYDGNVWNIVTLADYAADAVAVGETDSTKTWKTLDINMLIKEATEQNYTPKLYNEWGDNTDGSLTLKFVTNYIKKTTETEPVQLSLTTKHGIYANVDTSGTNFGTVGTLSSSTYGVTPFIDVRNYTYIKIYTTTHSSTSTYYNVYGGVFYTQNSSTYNNAIKEGQYLIKQASSGKSSWITLPIPKGANYFRFTSSSNPIYILIKEEYIWDNVEALETNIEDYNNRLLDINNYILGESRLLLLGLTYNIDEPVKNSNNLSLRMIKDIKSMEIDDIILKEDLKIYNENTYLALKSVLPYDYTTLYNNGDYALGCPDKLSLVIIKDLNVELAEGTIDVTIGDITNTINILPTDEVSDIINSIIENTWENWNLILDPTNSSKIIIFSTSLLNTITSPTISENLLGITGEGAVENINNKIYLYNNNNWSSKTLAEFAGDYTDSGVEDLSKMWRKLNVEDLNNTVKQNNINLEIFYYNNVLDPTELFNINNVLVENSNHNYYANERLSNGGRWTVTKNNSTKRFCLFRNIPIIDGAILVSFSYVNNTSKNIEVHLRKFTSKDSYGDITSSLISASSNKIPANSSGVFLTFFENSNSANILAFYFAQTNGEKLTITDVSIKKYENTLNSLKNVSTDIENIYNELDDLNLNTRHTKLLKLAKYIDDSTLAFSLLHFSDLHGDSIAYSELQNYIAKYGNFYNDIIETGDNVYQNYSHARLKVSNKALFVFGNHDGSSTNEGHDCDASKQWCFNAYFQPYLEDLGVGTEEGIHFPEGYNIEGDPHQYAMYWYKDYDNIRLIGLDCMHHLGRDNNLTDESQELWFMDTLNDAKIKGKKVMVACHYYLDHWGINQNRSSWNGNYERWNDVAHKWEYNFITESTNNNGGIVMNEMTGRRVSFHPFNSWPTDEGTGIDDGWGSLRIIQNGTEYPIDTNRFGDILSEWIAGGGNFIAWIAGHTHLNFMFYPKKYPNILNIVVSSAGTRRREGSGLANARNDGINKRMCANAYVVNGNYISVIRVGYNMECLTLIPSTWVTINYKTGRVISEG